MTTFAELRERQAGVRCNGCGGLLDRAVRFNMGVARNEAGEGTEWLYRKGMTICEPCALAAVEGALDALTEGHARRLLNGATA